jgi:fatty acid desaturase
MRLAIPFQRLAAFLCLIVLLLAALTPSVASHTFAVLVILCCVLPIVLFVQLADVDEEGHPQQAAVDGPLEHASRERCN